MEHAQIDLCDGCKHLARAVANKPLRKPADFLSLLKDIRVQKQEYLVCFSLDSRQHLIARRVITIGLLDSSLAHPREVYAGAISDRAASVIICHNHPSGDTDPSRDDITTTQQLAAAGVLLVYQCVIIL
jgi:DNA repair protein RadC